MHRLLAVCVLLTSGGAHCHLFHRLLTRSQLLAPAQPAAAAANRNEALPAYAVDTVWSKTADHPGYSVLYFVEEEQELFVFGEDSAPIMTVTSAPATGTSAPATGTSAPATGTSAPATGTSAPATGTNAPTTGTSAPTTVTSESSSSSNATLLSSTIPPAPAPILTAGITTYANDSSSTTGAPTSLISASTSLISASTTSTNAPATNTRTLTNSTSAHITTTSAPTTSTNAPLPLHIPPGYTYKSATGSSYKFHNLSYVSWYTAKETCASEGADLLVVNNEEEADIVASIVRGPTGYYFSSWTGLHENGVEGKIDWRTVHGEPLSEVFHEWDYGGPLNNGRWKCAYFSGEKKQLTDYTCDSTWLFVCERSQ